MGDLDLNLREGLKRTHPTHAQSFEPHSSAAYHSLPKKVSLPITPLIADHLLEKGISNSF